jgi:hypothetical protein
VPAEIRIQTVPMTAASISKIGSSCGSWRMSFGTFTRTVEVRGRAADIRRKNETWFDRSAAGGIPGHAGGRGSGRDGGTDSGGDDGTNSGSAGGGVGIDGLSESTHDDHRPV